MNVSVLVALRDDSPDQWRVRQWRFLEGLYRDHFPTFEIVVGTDDNEGVFHKTLALNRAARYATGDVFYLTDADTWVPPSMIRAGMGLVGETWVRPWTLKVKLGREDSETVMATENWDGTVPKEWANPKRAEFITSFWKAPPMLLTREHWATVNGQDQRMRGWGCEDEAFAYALRALVGRPASVKGQAIHLWHPRMGKSGHDRWSEDDTGMNNIALRQQYERALRHPEKMRELVKSR